MKAILTYIILTLLPVVAFTQDEDILEEILPNQLITNASIKKIIKKYWHYGLQNYFGNVDSSLILEAEKYFDKNGNLLEEKIISSFSTESIRPFYNKEDKIQFVRRLTERSNGQFIDTLFYSYDSLNRLDEILRGNDKRKYIDKYYYNINNKVTMKKGYFINHSGNIDSARISVKKYYYDKAGQLNFIEKYFGGGSLEERTIFYRDTDRNTHVIVKEKFYLENGESKSSFTFFLVLYNERRLPENCFQYMRSSNYPFYALNFEYEFR
jgi:hypothetical protein